MAEITLTESNFDEEVLHSDKPVLVDFWATWCGPCKMLAPVLQQAAEEHEGALKVGKVNVDDQRSLALHYGISSIPTLILFKNGKIIDTSVGFLQKAQLERFISQVL